MTFPPCFFNRATRLLTNLHCFTVELIHTTDYSVLILFLTLLVCPISFFPSTIYNIQLTSFVLLNPLVFLSFLFDKIFSFSPATSNSLRLSCIIASLGGEIIKK